MITMGRMGTETEQIPLLLWLLLHLAVASKLRQHEHTWHLEPASDKAAARGTKQIVQKAKDKQQQTMAEAANL